MTERYRNIYTRRISRTKGERERDPRLLTLAPIVRIARGNRAFTYLQGKNAIRSLAYLSSSATLSPPFPLYFFRDFSHGFGDCDTSDNVNLCNTPRCERGLSRVCFALATSSKRERELSFLPSFLPFLLPLYFFDAHTERISSYPLGKK